MDNFMFVCEKCGFELDVKRNNCYPGTNDIVFSVKPCVGCNDDLERELDFKEYVITNLEYEIYDLDNKIEKLNDKILDLEGTICELEEENIELKETKK